MTTTTMPPATPPGPEPDPRGQYTDTIDRVSAAVVRLTDRLATAPGVRPNRRSRLLAEMHAEVRAMALDLNHALGDWPTPAASEEVP
jgi:hypothetical protein